MYLFPISMFSPFLLSTYMCVFACLKLWRSCPIAPLQLAPRNETICIAARSVMGGWEGCCIQSKGVPEFEERVRLVMRLHGTLRGGAGAEYDAAGPLIEGNV